MIKELSLRQIKQKQVFLEGETTSLKHYEI